jgi:predicted unusual protein kinase regulating ubiquinone biosynthesis (AarF/ABC1/UbiB family)
MSELQDNLPPFPTYTAFSIIEEELGHPIDMLFSYLSDTPVASASFGQVCN